MRYSHFASVGFGWLLFASVGWSDVRLPAVFGDHMVLQREAPVPVWGWADAGETVTVTVAGQTKTATAGADGKWSLALDPLKSGGEPLELTVAGKNSRTLKDILVGEVWVGSGQSNMEWAVQTALEAEQEIASATEPQIRLFKMKRRVSDQPEEDTEAAWSVCSPETIKTFSAAAYFFARELRKTVDAPFGLIQSAWGGTPAESWTPREALAADPGLKTLLDDWDRRMKDYPRVKAEYDREIAEFRAASEKAKAEGKPAPEAPDWPPLGPDHPHKPTSLWNGMIRPVVPFAIRGVIWYQGEANTDRPFQYRTLFPALIASWRKAWGAGDFPFLYVQIAGYGDPKPAPAESSWAALREAQEAALTVPNVGMISAIDIGESKDIHPKNKQEVGRRLARAALAKVYGKETPHEGPVFEEMKVEGEKARLSFRHADGGLKVRTPAPSPAAGSTPLGMVPPAELGAGVPRGFEIAGDDMKFAWADAMIDGSTVVLSSPKVPKPVAVRYAWADYTDVNLYNREGLPALPFRTDDWPWAKVKNR